jgi:ribosomal protein S18 acetylase RimI-like enzyme
MRLEIRRAKIGDEGVSRDLRVQALTDAPEAFSSTLEREQARTIEDWRKWMAPGVTFLVLADSEPRGLVAGVSDAENRALVHLMAMWVHPAVRGTGAADLLVEAVKKWAVEMGATEVRLGVVETNARARRCYERNGFRETGRRGVVAKSGEAEIEMVWMAGAESASAATEL